VCDYLSFARAVGWQTNVNAPMNGVIDRPISARAQKRLEAFRQALANNQLAGIELDERTRAYCEALTINDSLTNDQRVAHMIAFLQAKK